MGKKSKKKGRTSGHKIFGGPTKKVPPSGTWKIGDTVVVCGLKQATRFNGKNGTIISEPKDSGSRYGVSVDGHQVAVLPSNLESSVEHVQEYSHEFFKQLREEEAQISRDNESSIGAIQRMMSMFMTEEHEIELYGRKIKPLPDFRYELHIEDGGFPKGVDSNWAKRYLGTAFEQGSLAPHVYESLAKSPDYEPHLSQVLMRYGTNNPVKLDWFYDPRRQLGDIFPQKVSHYPTYVRHSYRNQAYRKEILFLGTTHVSVAFTDLGILLEADLTNSPKPGHDGPLCFLGIDKCPYAVAKTLLVWEMIRQSQQEDHLRYVMQVWFSSTLEAKAEEYAKKILTWLCDSEEKRHPKVDALLHYWKDAEKMSLEKARSHWANNSTPGSSFISHFEKKQDRLDMTKYELTGDFGIEDDGKAVYGNVIMFDCPEGTPQLLQDENVFSAFYLKTISSSVSPSTTVFEATQQHIMEGLSKVACWARQNMVTINLVCDDVRNVTDMIAATKPRTVSWSDVLDFMDYADFHRLARACSIHGHTVHSGFSANWLMNVFGVHIFDYADPEQRGQIIESANGWIETFYNLHGWEKYLRLPPPTSPVKTTSFLLEIEHFKKWVDHFFGIGRREGPCRVVESDHCAVSVLSHAGSSTTRFVWTYDPEIKFKDTVNQILG